VIELLPFGVVVLYYLPLMVAAARDHKSFMPIFLVNTFLGFTGVGWLAALAWACLTPAHPAAARLPRGPRLVRVAPEADATRGTEPRSRKRPTRQAPGAGRT